MFKFSVTQVPSNSVRGINLRTCPEPNSGGSTPNGKNAKIEHSPRELCSIWVSFEFLVPNKKTNISDTTRIWQLNRYLTEKERNLYGTWPDFEARADITSPSAERDLFINWDSFNLSPSTSIFPTRSLPAKSTSQRWLLVLCPFIRFSPLTVTRNKLHTDNFMSLPQYMKALSTSFWLLNLPVRSATELIGISGPYRSGSGSGLE